MLDGVSVVYSQDISSGIGAIPEGQTWYTCSKGITDFIGYNMKVVETPQTATPGFGTVEIGNHPKQFDKEGLLTFVANYTGIRYLIEPGQPQVLYLPDISCGTEPVPECDGKTDPPLPVQQIFCLGIVNPNQHETKFTASISFDANIPVPILIIPPLPEDPSPSPSSTTSSIDPNETRSFPFNAANRSIIDFGQLLVISLLFSILISIFSM